jgi:hypothetical protein
MTDVITCGGAQGPDPQDLEARALLAPHRHHWKREEGRRRLSEGHGAGIRRAAPAAWRGGDPASGTSAGRGARRR